MRLIGHVALLSLLSPLILGAAPPGEPSPRVDAQEAQTGPTVTSPAEPVQDSSKTEPPTGADQTVTPAPSLERVTAPPSQTVVTPQALDQGSRVIGTLPGAEVHGRVVATMDVARSPIVVHLNGTQLYVGGSSGELILFDISNPAEPRLINATRLESRTPGGVADIRAIGQAGNRLFVLSWDAGQWMLSVLDITDPRAPRQAAKRTFPAAEGGAPFDLPVERSELIVLTGAFVHILNIGDANRPVEAGRLALDRPTSVARWDSRLFVVVYGGLAVVDISDPSAPRLSATVLNGGGDRGMPVEVRRAGNLLVVTMSGGGVSLIDPRTDGAVLGSTAERGGPTRVVGQLPDGRILLRQQEDSLYFVVDITDPAAPRTTDMILDGPYAGGMNGWSLVRGNYIYEVINATNQLRVIRVD